MKEIIKFLNRNYKNAIMLDSEFNITKTKEWDPQIYLNELYVQVGHVFNVLYPSESSKEVMRKIDNLGDELSDVLLQLINLATKLNINMYEIKTIDNFNGNNLNDLSILLGQLTEAIMEVYNCRFRKDRVDFESSHDFIKDRLFKIFIITYNIAISHNLDMNKEFKLMVKDATGFLKRFKDGNKNVKEYIDIYDSNENLLGYCEKGLAHQVGHWHKVFGCLIFNSKKHKVFFQLKNPKHNNIHKKELLEITAGGHLMAGETLNQGIREIKEETGIDVTFEELLFLEKRKCNKKIKENYIIKEFQYYYGLDRNVSLNDFNNYDESEVSGIVELKINDVIKLLKCKKNTINGKLLKNKEIKDIKISLSNFDNAFVKNKLFLSLILNCNKNKEKISDYKKIKEMYSYTQKQIQLNPNNYFYDKGQVVQMKDYKKGNIRCSIVLLNTDTKTNKHITFIMINKNRKTITQLLREDFNSKRESIKSFNDLIDYVESSELKTIINDCYYKIAAYI